MRRFYDAIFSENEEEMLLDFRRGLMREYISEMDLAALTEGLDYILEAEMSADRLKASDVIFIHGTADRIAPIEEARAICCSLPRARFISVEGSGHAPFLRPDFKKVLYDPTSVQIRP